MAPEARLTFAEHISELRRRLMWSLLFVAIGSGLGYILHDPILAVLQQPLHETLYYTTPTGAFSFIIKLSVVFGLVVALPVVVYQIFGFFGPLLPARSRWALVRYVFFSLLLASAGIVFAYFISLPAALHFLVNFGNSTGSIEALITADEYFNFVLTYIAGFAILFQLPLIITFINRVTPLPPRKLLGTTRYVVLGSFIAAAIITPTPDPFNQALMAGPIIVLFLFSTALVSLLNRNTNQPEAEPKKPYAAPPQGTPHPQPVHDPPPPALLSPTPAPSIAIPKKTMRSVGNDMIAPQQARSAPAYQPRPMQPSQRPPQRQRRPTRLISDFVPIAD